MLVLERVQYTNLNARQQEAFNFQKISAVLADYGYLTLRLQDDWQGADFIAQHCSGQSFLRVQLKGRLTIHKKYLGKNLHVAFPDGGHWYIYAHDELVEFLTQQDAIVATPSWAVHGGYSWPVLPSWIAKAGVLQRLDGWTADSVSATTT